MKFLAAYLLASLSEETVTAAKLEAILSSVGIDADSEKINLLLTELEGKDINQVIAEGAAKMASIPSGGAVAAAGGAKPAAGGAAAAAAPVEEAKAEEEEASDEDMGFGLFD